MTHCVLRARFFVCWLPFGTLQKTFIEKATAIKVNVLMALKRKEGD